MVVSSSGAQQPGLIVRDTDGLTQLEDLCPLLQCRVVESLGDPQGKVFLIAPVLPGTLDELLQIVPLLPEAQASFNVPGSGIVAIVDIGVDPLHPVLAPVLLPGYNFVTNTNGADESGDLDHSTEAVLDGGGGSPTYVNPWTAAIVSQAGVDALDNSQYAAFGHRTMVAGIVHLVAPTAKLLPLKVFSSNGIRYASDIVLAIYYATAQRSKAVSMSFSFSFTSPSRAMLDAIKYVNGECVICGLVPHNRRPGVYGSTHCDTLADPLHLIDF